MWKECVMGQVRQNISKLMVHVRGQVGKES